MYQNQKKSHKGRVTTVRNQQVQTDKTIPNNKQNTIIRDNGKRTRMLNSCNNLRRQKCDKDRSREDSKFKDLTVEIQRMVNVKTNVIPVIIGATRTISKSFRKYLSNVPGKHEVKELQKTATLCTAHILRKVLM
jgi:hypothetical protein